MKNFLCLLLAAMLMLGCLSGCAAEDTPYVPTGRALAAEDADLEATEGSGEEEDQAFSLAYYPDRSLNPFTCNDYTNRTLFSLIYQGLFSVGQDYQAVPILCDRFEVSSDSRQYTFYIRSATFSDGTALTINDVYVSYQTARESSYYGGRFTHISDISLTDDGGIRFTLNTAMEDLPILLDIPIIKASQVEAELPLGTGPYVLEDTIAGTHLRRNPAWWCQSEAADLVVTAGSIPLLAAENPIEIRDGFEFSDVGLVCADPCADNYADYRCDYELWDCENGIFLYLACNVSYSKVFSDSRLRTALTYAIDRETLAQDNYRGFARAVTLPASPSFPGYSAGLAAKYEYDPVTFINALSSTGKPGDPVQLLVNSDDSLRLRTARNIAEMLTECGLETVTMEMDSREYIRTIHNGARSDGVVFDLYLGATKLSPNMDLSEFFRPWGDMSYNGMSDATIYEYCLDALENSGNYYNFHKSVADDGRLVPILFCSYAVYAERGLLTDLEPSRDNVFFYTLGRTESDALIAIDYSQQES